MSYIIIIALVLVCAYLLRQLHIVRLARIAAEKRRKREFIIHATIAGITLAVLICHTR